MLSGDEDVNWSGSNGYIDDTDHDAGAEHDTLQSPLPKQLQQQAHSAQMLQLQAQLLHQIRQNSDSDSDPQSQLHSNERVSFLDNNAVPGAIIQRYYGSLGVSTTQKNPTSPSQSRTPSRPSSTKTSYEFKQQQQPPQAQPIQPQQQPRQQQQKKKTPPTGVDKISTGPAVGPIEGTPFLLSQSPLVYNLEEAGTPTPDFESPKGSIYSLSSSATSLAPPRRFIPEAPKTRRLRALAARAWPVAGDEPSLLPAPAMTARKSRDSEMVEFVSASDAEFEINSVEERDVVRFYPHRVSSGLFGEVQTNIDEDHDNSDNHIDIIENPPNLTGLFGSIPRLPRPIWFSPSPQVYGFSEVENGNYNGDSESSDGGIKVVGGGDMYIFAGV